MAEVRHLIPIDPQQLEPVAFWVIGRNVWGEYSMEFFDMVLDGSDKPGYLWVRLFQPRTKAPEASLRELRARHAGRETSAISSVSASRAPTRSIKNKRKVAR